jgi:hypothetical protein
VSPYGTGRGTRPLSLEVRLDAVAAVILDGLSYRRAARMVGVSKTEVGDSLDLLLPRLAALGTASPTAPSSPPWPTLASGLGRWPRPARRWWTGWPPGCSGPPGRPTRRCKRHAHTAQGLVVSTIWGDLSWVDGGWPGSCHEHELIALSGLGGMLDATGVASLVDRGVPGAGQGARALACAGRRPPHQGPPHQRP